MITVSNILLSRKSIRVWRLSSEVKLFELRTWDFCDRSNGVGPNRVRILPNRSLHTHGGWQEVRMVYVWSRMSHVSHITIPAATGGIWNHGLSTLETWLSFDPIPCTDSKCDMTISHHCCFSSRNNVLGPAVALASEYQSLDKTNECKTLIKHNWKLWANTSAKVNPPVSTWHSPTKKYTPQTNHTPLLPPSIPTGADYFFYPY